VHAVFQMLFAAMISKVLFCEVCRRKQRNGVPSSSIFFPETLKRELNLSDVRVSHGSSAPIDD
jgi:hypothetical protein